MIILVICTKLNGIACENWQLKWGARRRIIKACKHFQREGEAL